jgi:hypothetical protein
MHAQRLLYKLFQCYNYHKFSITISINLIIHSVQCKFASSKQYILGLTIQTLATPLSKHNDHYRIRELGTIMIVTTAVIVKVLLITTQPCYFCYSGRILNYFAMNMTTFVFQNHYYLLNTSE